MSLHESTVWVEIPIIVHAERIPAEAPDFSELSPCAGSPESTDICRIEMPEVPREGGAVEQWLKYHCPNWLEQVDTEIDKQLSE